MLHSDQEEALFAVSASITAVLEVEERVELTDDLDSARSGEAVVMPGFLELAVVYCDLAVESVEEREQLEVLERPGWTALVIHCSILGLPLASDDRVEASAEY